MVKSAVFLFIEILFLYNLLKIKINDKIDQLVTRLPLMLIIIMCIHAMGAGILSLFGINISLISIGIIDLILLILLFIIRTKTCNQKYQFSKNNSLFYISLTLGVVLFGLVLFGRKLEIHFWSVDASAHYSMAQYVVKNHSFNNNLYFSALNNGLAMMVMKPFVGEQFLYKVFIVMELFDLWIAGALFYGFINQIKQDKGIKSIVITAMYLLGYPLYAIIFGFSYFGAAISLMVAGVCIEERYYAKDITNKQFIVCMNLVLFSLFVCYTYLVPVMFGALFVLIILDKWKTTGKVVSKEMILEELKIFLIPCCLGMIFSISNLKELGSGGGITNPGGCYFDLYSNFLLFCFLIVIGVYLSIKEKKILSVNLLSVFSLIFLALLLCMSVQGKASIYYVSKIYNVIWFCAFVHIYLGIRYLWNKYIELHKMIFVTMGIMGISFLFSIFPSSLNSAQYLRSGISGFGPDIYYFNMLARTNGIYISDNEIKSYITIGKKYGNIRKQNIVSVGYETNCGWFRALTEQDTFVSYDINQLKEKLNKTEYVFCMNNSSLVNENRAYLQSLGNIVYSNDYGFVIEITD